MIAISGGLMLKGLKGSAEERSSTQGNPQPPDQYKTEALNEWMTWRSNQSNEKWIIITDLPTNNSHQSSHAKCGVLDCPAKIVRDITTPLDKGHNFSHWFWRWCVHRREHLQHAPPHTGFFHAIPLLIQTGEAGAWKITRTVDVNPIALPISCIVYPVGKLEVAR